VLPGPSAVETALVASGLAADQYRFLGWLPRRVVELDALWAELAGWPHPAVAFESPRRIGASLARLATVDPERPVAVCRELTKRFEEVVRGSASELALTFRQPPRGELTVVVGAAAAVPEAGADDVVAVARAAVAELVAGGASRRTAAEVVARLTGASRRRLYRDSL
jgi:16S rRNA (cytidine1402-2'-O)-methyltransferase